MCKINNNIIFTLADGVSPPVSIALGCKSKEANFAGKYQWKEKANLIQSLYRAAWPTWYYSMPKTL